MATTGYRSAIVQLPGRVRVRGTPTWLGLHLATLLGNFPLLFQPMAL